MGAGVGIGRKTGGGTPGARRHFRFYPTKFPHEPLDSKTKEVSEEDEERPRGDKLRILHLIRQRRIRPVQPVAGGARQRSLESDEESLGLYRRMEVSAERMKRILGVMKGRNESVSGPSSAGLESNGTQYFVSLLFILYAVLLFMLFKFRIFRRYVAM